MMIQCPVCSHINDDLLIRCASCGSNIQERVPNLDLFSTVWLLIESPTTAFKKIILAEQKNYVILLSLFCGIALVFALLWGMHVGDRVDNFFYVLLTAIIVGCVVGVPVMLFFSYIIHLLLKLVKGEGTFRNTLAITGWSTVPIMLSVVFILPIELATLGSSFFSTNPHPFTIKPAVYSVLIGLDGIAVLWSVTLYIIGLQREQKTNIFITLFCVLAVCGGIGLASIEVTKKLL